MKPDFRHSLLLAFESGRVRSPASGEAWAVLNARTLPGSFLDKSGFVFEQGFRPEYLALQKAGWTVEPKLDPSHRFDNVIVMAGRVRAINEANIARAWKLIEPGGTIMVCGDKTAGIASLRKWANARVRVDESFSKHHAVVFWFRKDDGKPILASGDEAVPRFSAEAPDTGSMLLTRFFDDRIKGAIADFGAGDGFLSAELLANCPQVTAMDLLEAEWAALEMAKQRLSDARIPPGFHWIDITTELKKKPRNWVIMNPPFHHGLHGSRESDPELGKRFIQCAASTLVQGGRLLMVANRNLPYEQTLQATFRRVEKLADENGYKVFEAMR